MFSKLRLDKCYNYNNNEKENQNSYTQRSISRKMAKEKLTYSEIHRQTKRNLESKSQYEVQWAPKFLFQGFINKFHEKAG